LFKMNDMKTLKEQLLEILNTWIEAGATEDKYKTNQPDIEITGFDMAVSKLESLIKERFVEKEPVPDSSICNHPANRLHGFGGVYYCDKCRETFRFELTQNKK
jgi:hypothetical protein